MSTAIAKNLMAEMKLLGMFAAYDQAIADATRDQTSYSEFLDTLLAGRGRLSPRAQNRLPHQSRQVHLRPAFEDIDFTASRSISKAQIKELYSLQWLNDARPVLLIGQTGVGKTFIAQATGLHACACGKSVLYMTVTTLAGECRARPIQRHVPALSRQARQVRSDHPGRHGDAEIVVHRSAGSVRNPRGAIDRQVHAFTTQLPLDHWSEVIPDPVIADAIRDRLEHSALTINITGESYRGVKARKLASKKKDA
jgi:DNA replication protein DnaC